MLLIGVLYTHLRAIGCGAKPINQLNFNDSKEIYSEDPNNFSSDLMRVSCVFFAKSDRICYSVCFIMRYLFLNLCRFYSQTK
ncbi:Uncharacterised protein [Sphingobacterium daejeonense]|nr:Uncharacterised protein [Sphingobacterium daejeonense]